MTHPKIWKFQDSSLGTRISCDNDSGVRDEKITNAAEIHFLIGRGYARLKQFRSQDLRGQIQLSLEASNKHEFQITNI